MLRKLLKYDFRELGSLIFPVLGALILITIIGKISIETALFQALPSVIQGLGIAAYVVIILACFIGAPLYFVIYFYKNLYSSAGYITHTLPVSTNEKLLSKIISCYLLELLTFAVCFLSILIIVYDKALYNDLYNLFVSGDMQVSAVLGMNIRSFVIITGALLLISSLAQLLMYFASVSIGQLFRTHKIIGTIAGYMILYAANQIISSVILVIFGSPDVMYNTMPTAGSIVAIYGISGCLCLLQAAIYYVISYYFMEKKLNLI